jgi:hypothetical protein
MLVQWFAAEPTISPCPWAAARQHPPLPAPPPAQQGPAASCLQVCACCCHSCWQCCCCRCRMLCDDLTKPKAACGVQPRPLLHLCCRCGFGLRWACGACCCRRRRQLHQGCCCLWRPLLSWRGATAAKMAAATADLQCIGTLSKMRGATIIARCPCLPQCTSWQLMSEDQLPQLTPGPTAHQRRWRRRASDPSCDSLPESTAQGPRSAAGNFGVTCMRCRHP